MASRPAPLGPMAPLAPSDKQSSGFSAAVLHIWTKRGLVAYALWPVSVLYGLVSALRRWAYRVGVFKSQRLPVPVVVVGNVVAGGAGKTPVVMLLAAHLGAKGLRLGVVSRGYGRHGTDCREVLADSPAREVGDEPKLIQQATDIPVFVAPTRHAAGVALLAKYPRTQLILCDDGLQHPALQRDLEICVFDDRGLGNGFLLPAGPLREAWPRAVDFVVHTGEQPALAGGFHVPRHLSTQAHNALGAQVSLAELASQPLIAVAAIAQPEHFFAMLRAQGLTLAHTIALPDHYDFASWKRPFAEAFKVVCTQKDAVKLWPQHPDILAVPLILTPEPTFLTALDQAMHRLLNP
jgi:tetraacyldisaccharide 4'-kinase